MNCSLHNGTENSVESRLLNSMDHILNHYLKTTKPWRSRGLPQNQVVWETGANALKGVEGASECGGTSAGVNKFRCPIPDQESGRITRSSQRGQQREGVLLHQQPFPNLTQDTQSHLNSHTAAKLYQVSLRSECRKTSLSFCSCFDKKQTKRIKKKTPTLSAGLHQLQHATFHLYLC